MKQIRRIPQFDAQKVQRTCASLIVALPLTFAAAGAITITSSLVEAPPAAAFGLSDITGAAKKVGGAVKGAAKSVAKDAKNSAKIVGSKAKKVGKGAASNARDFGGALKRDAKSIGSKVKGGAASVARAAEGAAVGAFAEIGTRPAEGLNKLGTKLWGAKDADWAQGRRDLRDAYAGAKRKVKNIVTGNNKIGESLPRESAQQRARRKAKMEGALGRYVNQRGTSTSKAYKYRGPSGTLKTGIVRDKKFRGGSSTVTLKPGIVKNKPSRGDYTGGYREKIGNDKSVWGRPIYRKHRPTGEKQKIGIDRSVYGRPVYGKRPGKPNRKVQGIRLGDIKTGAKRTRALRKKNSKFTKDRRLKRDRKRFTKDRRFKRDRKRFTKDRRFKRDRKRFTKDRRFKRKSRTRMSRQFRNNRKSRGFQMKPNRNRGSNRRRNNRRNR